MALQTLDLREKCRVALAMRATMTLDAEAIRELATYIDRNREREIRAASVFEDEEALEAAVSRRLADLRASHALSFVLGALLGALASGLGLVLIAM